MGESGLPLGANLVALPCHSASCPCQPTSRPRAGIWAPASASCRCCTRGAELVKASALTHHPHVHMVVPGGGLSADGSKWIACRPDYFLCVEVLSALFRRLFLEMLVAAHDAGRLQFFGDHVGLADRAAFNAYIAPLRDIDWVVYAKKPFAGPEQVLHYLSRYTHRIAISNRRRSRPLHDDDARHP